MTYAATYAAPRSAPLARPASNVEQLSTRLYAALLLDKPRRAARMNGPNSAIKYKDALGHSFSVTDLIDHISRKATWAVTLGTNEAARSGCRDYDGDDGQGAALGLAALDAAAGQGVTAFAILLGGRSHVWALYQRAAPVCDIVAQMAELPTGLGEVYPSGNCIRLPFGYHRVKGTRGQLVLQNGQRYNLDDPAALAAGLAAVLSLPRNAAPSPAPASLRLKSTSGAAPVDPAVWASLPSGATLMSTARYTALFTRRPQLNKLAAGQYVTLPTIHGMRDSGSEQVAVLISNLLTTGRSAEPGGPLVPGCGAPPLTEVRAIALHWRTTLRPDYDFDAYRTDVDRLIVEYTPAGYAPEATQGYASAAVSGQAAPPLPLVPACASGRPSGQRAAQAERLALLLAERVGDVVKRCQLAAAIGVTERMVSYLLADLRVANRLTTAPARDGFTVVSLAINSPDEPCNRSNSPLTAEDPVSPIVTRDSGPEVEACNKEGKNTPPPPAPAGLAQLPAGLAESPQPPPRAASVLPCVEPARLTLAELVTEAYDSYPQRGPAKLRAIVAHVGPGYTAVEIRTAYEAEKKCRSFASYSKKAREIAGKLADLSNKDLAARTRSVATSLDYASAPLPTLRPDEPAEKLAGRIAAHQRAQRSKGLHSLTHRLAIAERGHRERAANRELARLESQGAALGAGAYGVDQAELDRTIAAVAAAAPAHKPRVVFSEATALTETPALAARPLTNAERCRRATAFVMSLQPALASFAD